MAESIIRAHVLFMRYKREAVQAGLLASPYGHSTDKGRAWEAGYEAALDDIAAGKLKLAKGEGRVSE